MTAPRSRRTKRLAVIWWLAVLLSIPRYSAYFFDEPDTAWWRLLEDISLAVLAMATVAYGVSLLVDARAAKNQQA